MQGGTSSSRGGGNGKGDFGVAGDFWRVEEEEAIDKAGGESGGIEAGAGFEEDIEDFASAEFLQDSIEIEFALPARDAQKFDAGVLQLAGFWRFERGCGEDEEIVVGGFDDARVGGETQA